MLQSLIFFLTIFLSFAPKLSEAQAAAFGALLGKPAAATGPLSALPTEESDRATQKFLTSVFEKSPAMENVNVEVVSGVIYLKGEIASPADADWMLKIVSRVPNVVAVTNKTVVSGVDLAQFDPMWKEVDSLIEKLKRHLPSLFFAVLFSVLAYFLSSYLLRFTRSVLGRRISNPFLLSIVTRISMLPVWLVLLYIVLRLLGLSTLGATLIGGTGLFGIVLGLAFKGIAENYLAGLLLASRSPFTRGDIIRIGEYEGYVENLNMRGTTIIDLNGNLVLIPNLTVIQSVVENQTANPKTRTSFTVGIGYQDSISKAQDLVIQAVSDVVGVIADPAPNVVVTELRNNCVELKVYIWFNSKNNRELRVRSRAIIKTKEVLLANGFTIPGETRELYFGNSLHLQSVDLAQNGPAKADQRKSEIQQKAERNLTEPESQHATEGPSGEDMLKLAEDNPLPTNVSDPGLLSPKPEKR